MDEQVLKDGVSQLLASLGLGETFELKALPCGGNNKVFQVSASGKVLFLKQYFFDPQDKRDRLGAEFAFTQYAWGLGVRAIPQPLASDPAQHLALYSFISGRKLAPSEIDQLVVEYAVHFYQSLNPKPLDSACPLGAASEACFSLQAHLDRIDVRIARLLNNKPSSDLEREALTFVEDEVLKLWKGIRPSIVHDTAKLKISLEGDLPLSEQCISPSDFGFHNAIFGDDGKLYFIDFEYAGRDDLAKLVCDFFCQPAFAIGLQYFGAFVDGIVERAPNPELQRARIKLLFPAYQIKWCCILLNEFLPSENRRRRFASGSRENEHVKVEQLRKAKEFFSRVTYGLH